ncbi:protein lava lamp isoform X2 [Scaptodrosophila lebanonensis]|uniref:Protein lava lamp isoform X2 n=1 Tax=Drosophila lebanonensis TaxID=7225 RepID=A0A6J2TZ95_DROLE|nr:protein lava lamp isoform X2 [Scaptodrosophila lebanonensis]
MSQDNTTDAGLENSLDFSMVEDLSNNDDVDEIRVSGSSTDLSLLQNLSIITSGGGSGQGRLDSLRENLSKQQERLSALREQALRKTEGGRRKSSMSDSMESLKSLGQKFTVLKGRSGTSRNESTDSHCILNEMAQRNVSTPITTKTKDAAGSHISPASPPLVTGNEKLIMLTQRTIQNRALLEQRKRDIAKSLLSVKSSLASTTGELGSSMTDLRTAEPSGNVPVSRHRSAADLQLKQQTGEQFDEGRLKLLKNKIKINEMKQSRKEQELTQELNELRNELTKQVNRIEELEQCKEQLQKTLTERNEDLETLRQTSELGGGNTHLQNEIAATRLRNSELEDINDMLETTRRELQEELCKAQEKLSTTESDLYALQEKQQNLELEPQQEKSSKSSSSTESQVNIELAKQVQELEQKLEQLQKQHEELRSENAANVSAKLDVTDTMVSERLAELEAIIETQRVELEVRAQKLNAQEEDLAEKTTELNVLNVNLRLLEEKLAQSTKSKPIFLAAASDIDVSEASEELKAELQQLKQKLDESNKSNIKLKLRCKQTEKQMEKLKTSSELHKELSRLTAANNELQQRVSVLEDEKGQWQLVQMHDNNGSEEDEQITPSITGVAQQETIRLLEEQKLELQQALKALQQGSESARVESEISEVQLEEQLSQRVQQLESEAQEQREKIQMLQNEKEELDKKLSHYINENMELLDKLEKLSKSSSSAESIEIVERPTQQERAELERFNKRRPVSEGDERPPTEEDDGSVPDAVVLPSFVSELTQTDTNIEASEGAELLAKIELFTTERREVLERMEHLNAENVDLQSKLEQYAREAQQLESAKSKLEQELEDVQREKQLLVMSQSQLSSDSNTGKSNLTQELSSMQKSSEVVAALDSGEGTALFDKCERSLCKLNSELQAYRKANDRNAKFNVSKKLAKEAKNVHTQLTELLQKVKEASNAVETVTVVETVVAVTAPNGKALAEYEQLTAQNAELKATLATLQLELSELRDHHEDSKEPEPLPAHLAIATYDAQIETDRQQKVAELKVAELQVTVEELGNQLREANYAHAERLQQLTEQSDELRQLQLQVEQFDHTLNKKEMAHEKQVEQLTRVRRELEGKNETYEAEMQILQTLVAEQKQQLIEAYSESEHKLNMKLLELQQCHEDLASLRAELEQRRSEGEGEEAALAEECSKLREALKINKTLASQQVIELANKQETIDSLNQNIMELYETLEQRAEALSELDAEHNKSQVLSERQVQLEAQMNELKTAYEASEARNKELREKLKKYAANLKKRGMEITELEQQVKMLQESDHHGIKSEPELPNVTSVQLLLNTEHQLQQKQTPISKIYEELNLDSHDQKQQIQKSDQKSIKSQEEENQQQAKLLRLQDELQNAVHANTELRREWEQAERQWRERLEAAMQTTRHAGSGDSDGAANDQVLEDLRRQLAQKTTKFEKCKELIKQRNATIQNLQREVNDLRGQLRLQSEEDVNQMIPVEQHVALQEQHERLVEQYDSEKAAFEQTIVRLETLHEGIQAKLQQDRSYIDSLEGENDNLKCKLTNLEEKITTQAQLQATLEQRLHQKEETLQGQAHEQQERESLLRTELSKLSELNNSQTQQLAEAREEAEDARQRLDSLQGVHDTLLAMHEKLSSEIHSQREELTTRSDQELQELRLQLDARESEIQRQRSVYDAKLAAKSTELDELECDLSAHMERATAENRELTQQLERVQEQLQQRNEELASLNRELSYLRLQQDNAEQDVLELQELRMQALQDKTETDNLRAQIDTLCANHNQELQVLLQQIAELDTLGQNQTDDQVYIQTENKRLAEQLAELQARVAHYERATTSAPSQSNENAELTGVAVEVEPPQLLAAPAMFFGNDMAGPSPFDEIVQPRLTTTTLGASPALNAPLDGGHADNLEQPTIEDLQRNVSDLEKHAQDLETKLLARNQTLAEQEERQREAATLERQQLQQRLQLENYVAELKVRLDELEHQLRSRDQEISQLRASIEERERLEAVDKMIQPDFSKMAPTLDMFFGEGNSESMTKSGADGDLLATNFGQEQPEPVVEEVIIPKKAYICHPEHQQEVVDLGVDEDPWASAAAEQSSSKPQNDERVMELQRLLAAAEQQKADLQMKVTKLMKRVKEYKLKAVTTPTVPDTVSCFNELDNAIIEELKNQIQLHETKQSRTEELLQQQALEKEKLIKRIDVLTAGNDRMTELKERQDMDVQMYQARIRELQDKLNQLESWGVEDIKHDATPAVAVTPVSSAVVDELQSRIDDLQAENVELHAEWQELQTLLQNEKQTSQHAQTIASEAMSERDKLQANVQRQSDELKILQQQLTQLRDECQAKEQELVAAKAAQTSDLGAINNDQVTQLQERESEIAHLKQRIEELMREDQTEKLVFEILTKNQELQLLRMQVKQLEEEKQEEEEESKKAAPGTESANSALQLQLDEMRMQNRLLEQEKADMEEELQILNNHVLSALELEDKMKQSVLELDTKNIEISELRKSLDAFQQSQVQPQPQSLPPSMDNILINQQWEAVVERKCSEVAKGWEQHLAQREADFQVIESQLLSQIEFLKAAAKTADSTQGISYVTPKPESSEAVATETNDILLHMQKALETQEMEIVTLKEQLAIRSAEYARLAAQYDPFRLHNTLSESGGNGGAVTGTTGTRDSLPEYVLKADLDNALMMVHQRDMRVEEMILELVQLLEERDHLQLKLSDTLRQLEAERVRASDVEPSILAAKTGATSVGSNCGTASSSAGSGSPSKISSSSDLSAVNSTSGGDLKQKLAELQTVKHSKDKAIVDEREQRLQQMIQLQKDMAKQGTTTSVAPTTATVATTSPAATPIGAPQQQSSEIVDLSQTSLRSSSMALVDWILGSNKKEEEGGQLPSQN